MLIALNVHSIIFEIFRTQAQHTEDQAGKNDTFRQS